MVLFKPCCFVYHDQQCAVCSGLPHDEEAYSMEVTLCKGVAMSKNVINVYGSQRLMIMLSSCGHVNLIPGSVAEEF